MEKILASLEKREIGIMEEAWAPIKDIFLDALRGRRVIIYGGSAIDMLLGGAIYKPNEVHDFDIYTDNNDKLAAYIVYKFKLHGYKGVSIVPALNATTKKLMVDSIQIGDLNELPSKPFNLLYSGARIIDGLHIAPVSYLQLTLHKMLGDVPSSFKWKQSLERVRLMQTAFPPEKPTALATTYRFTATELQILGRLKSTAHLSVGADALESYIGVVPEISPAIRVVIDGDDLEAVAYELIPEMTHFKHNTVMDLTDDSINVYIGDACVAVLYKPLRCLAKVSYHKRRYPTIHVLLAIYGTHMLFSPSPIYSQIWEHLRWVFAHKYPSQKQLPPFSAECTGPFVTKFEAKRAAAREKK
jgi:hypothetical protein